MCYGFAACSIFCWQKILISISLVLLYLDFTLPYLTKYSALLSYHIRIYHNTYILAHHVFGMACYNFVAHCSTTENHLR